jgi:hypothetical protein
MKPKIKVGICNLRKKMEECLELTVMIEGERRRMNFSFFSC